MQSGTIANDGSWTTLWTGVLDDIATWSWSAAILSCCSYRAYVRITYTGGDGNSPESGTITLTSKFATGSGAGWRLCSWDGSQCTSLATVTKVELSVTAGGSCPAESVQYKVCVKVTDGDGYDYALV